MEAWAAEGKGGGGRAGAARAAAEEWWGHGQRWRRTSSSSAAAAPASSSSAAAGEGGGGEHGGGGGCSAAATAVRTAVAAASPASASASAASASALASTGWRRGCSACQADTPWQEEGPPCHGARREESDLGPRQQGAAGADHHRENGRYRASGVRGAALSRAAPSRSLQAHAVAERAPCREPSRGVERPWAPSAARASKSCCAPSDLRTRGSAPGDA